MVGPKSGSICVLRPVGWTAAAVNYNECYYIFYCVTSP